MAGFDPTTDREPLPGDFAIGLITAQDPEPRRQWLLRLSYEGVAEPADEKRPHTNTESESKSESESDAESTVLYASTGLKVEFPTEPARIHVEVAGPFTAEQAGPNPVVREADVRVNAALLGLGFDRAARTMNRVNTAAPDHAANPSPSGGVRARSFGLEFSGQPFDVSSVARGRALAARLDLTEDDVRALAGTSPALLSFFAIAQETPGLRDIVWNVIDRPSWFSIVRHGGVRTGIIFESRAARPLDPRNLGLASESPAFLLPVLFTSNDQPALRCWLVVTRPDPPWLLAAGVVRFVAASPNDPERRLMVEVIAAGGAHDGDATTHAARPKTAEAIARRAQDRSRVD